MGGVGGVEVDTAEPYTVLDGLPTNELEELQRDIAHYKEVFKENKEYVAYWNDLSVCCRDALATAEAQASGWPE